MKTLATFISLLSVYVLFATNVSAQAQNQIRVVGSSTVFPFVTAAAEEFGTTANFKTPIVEATGTGGGFKLFCAGVGFGHPDVASASRRIKPAELEMCRKNGVGDVVEVKIGYDGIVLAASRSAPKMRLSLRDLYLALAAKVPAPGTEGGAGKMIANPYTRWSDINPEFSNTRIQVFGPPPTSGTRDAFNELVVERGCATFVGMRAQYKTNPSLYKALCRGIREDGAYIEAGENDNLIVQKIQANTAAIGVFGYSFLDQNYDVIQAYSVSTERSMAEEPTFETIANGAYPITRSLFLYLKKAHVGVVPGLQEYLVEIVGDNASGDLGYLSDRGLIPLPDRERAHFQNVARALTPLSIDLALRE